MASLLGIYSEYPNTISLIGPISQLLDTQTGVGTKRQRVKPAMRQPGASRDRQLSGGRVQPRATGSADNAGYCCLKRRPATRGPFASFQPHQTTPTFARTHDPVTLVDQTQPIQRPASRRPGALATLAAFVGR